jgi:hypothetical protein
MHVQQHDVSPAATAPVPRERGKHQNDHPEDGHDVGRDRASAELLPRLRSGQQDDRVCRGAQNAAQWRWQRWGYRVSRSRGRGGRASRRGTDRRRNPLTSSARVENPRYSRGPNSPLGTVYLVVLPDRHEERAARAVRIAIRGRDDSLRVYRSGYRTGPAATPGILQPLHGRRRDERMVDVEYQEYRDVVYDAADLHRGLQAGSQLRADESQPGLRADSGDGYCDDFLGSVGDLACVGACPLLVCSCADVYHSISIPLIYGLAKDTDLVRHDPVLWFSMMLMPAGPPALIISGLAELARISEVERMTIAKTLSVSVI